MWSWKRYVQKSRRVVKKKEKREREKGKRDGSKIPKNFLAKEGSSMSKELKLKRCKHCNAIVKVVNDSDCISCCGNKMEDIIPNSVDAAIEKHVPEYEIQGDKIIVKVNHVMEDDHYIEWISMVSDKKENMVYLKPGEVAEVEFTYTPNSTLYAYCNKHSVWKKDVD